ncbi:MAG: CinA family protein [Candidatus Nanopelagicales bacterium]
MTDVAALLDRLAADHQTVSVAESLTGGSLLAALTEVPGASRVVVGGMVTYATDAKTVLAGVPRELLESLGPVNPQIARSLAEGARDRLRTTFGVGVTGVAGPTEQAGHPVGEVHLAVVGPLGAVTSSHDFSELADRHAIRVAAGQAALSLLDAVSRESTT